MSNIIGPEIGYVDLLNVATTKKLKEEQESGKTFGKPLRPSAAGKCTRELAYELMVHYGKAKYPVELKEPEVHRLLNLGHSIEYHIIKQFELISDIFDIRYKQQVLSFAYLEAKDDPKMSQWLEGSIDLVFWSEKYKCVADIKSKKDKWSAAFKSAWDDLDDKLRRMKSVTSITDDAYWVEDLSAFLEELSDPFFESNFLQLNLYATSDFLKERGITHGAIIQYCKNDSRLREVRFKPSQEVADRVKGKFQVALDAAAKGTPELAPKDHFIGSVKCAFCPYSAQCWNENALKAFYKTFPKKQWPTDTNRMGVKGNQLESLFAKYNESHRFIGETEKAEQDILKAMAEAEVNKVKLEDGSVYEAKFLKSPRPHMELRRSKA